MEGSGRLRTTRTTIERCCATRCGFGRRVCEALNCFFGSSWRFRALLTCSSAFSRLEPASTRAKPSYDPLATLSLRLVDHNHRYSTHASYTLITSTLHLSQTLCSILSSPSPSIPSPVLRSSSSFSIGWIVRRANVPAALPRTRKEGLSMMVESTICGTGISEGRGREGRKDGRVRIGRGGRSRPWRSA